VTAGACFFFMERVPSDFGYWRRTQERTVVDNHCAMVSSLPLPCTGTCPLFDQLLAGRGRISFLTEPRAWGSLASSTLMGKFRKPGPGSACHLSIR
jgi:hypothetical protein